MATKGKEQPDREEPQKAGEKQPLCFVIGPIGSEGSPERKHADMFLNAVVKDALKDLGFHIERADEVADPGMINDRVIHTVIHAELAIADLSFNNPNAFYELGIRHAAEKPVIHFAQKGTRLPFDTAGYRTIVEDITEWKGIESARELLRKSVEAVRKPGYKVSNPITQANASFRMRESVDPKDQFIVSLSERIESLETKQENLQLKHRLAEIGRILERALEGELTHQINGGVDLDRLKEM